MTVTSLTFLLKYKLLGSANQEVADYQSSLAQISDMRITAMTIERPTSMTWNLDNFGLRYVLSKYPSVINSPAKLLPSHGAPRRHGDYASENIIAVFYHQIYIFMSLSTLIGRYITKRPTCLSFIQLLMPLPNVNHATPIYGLNFHCEEREIPVVSDTTNYSGASDRVEEQP